MIASEITIKCTNKNQMTALGSFIWPAGSHLGRIIPVSETETRLENCCNEGMFENTVTGLALHFAMKYSGVPCTMTGWLDNNDNCYRYTIEIVYDGMNITTRLTTEDYLFKHGKICKDCNADMTEVYSDDGFYCPHCGSRYLPAGHPEETDAEYVFSNDACTYTIPAEEIYNT